MAGSGAATRIRPLIDELVENGYARENLREGAQNLRRAYQRSQKRRVKVARDERIRQQLQGAAASIKEGALALQSGRQKPKRRWGRRLLLVAGIGGAAIAIAIAAGDRGAAFGPEEVA